MHPDNRPGRWASRSKINYLNEAGRPNTLGLHQRELSELLDQYDIPDAPRKSVKRDFIRWPFRRSSVAVRVIHPNGVTARISVACRNISRGGMAILHSSFLHPGTRCIVTLPHLEKGEIEIDGWVSRCVHRTGMVHEIGLTFADSVDVRDILRPDPLSDCFSMERVVPEALEGRLLCIEPLETDRRVVQHFLRNTRLQVAMAASAAEAIDLLGRAWDVIIVDASASETGGALLVSELRQRGHSGPIIVTTAEAARANRTVLRAIEANAFVAKPLSQSLLLRAVAEFLIAHRVGSGPIYTSLAPDHPDYAQAESFVMGLRQMSKKLEDAMRRDDPASCRTLCQQLASSAPGLGFDELGKLSGDAANILMRTMSISAGIKEIRSLIAACDRTRAKKAA